MMMKQNNNENETMPPQGAVVPSEALPADAGQDITTSESAPTPIPDLPRPEAPLMDADGAFAPDWYKRFGELEPYGASLAKFRRPEALAKSYAHLERLKGYPDTTDSRRMAAFRAAVGLPESAEQFSIDRPEDTPDERWNPALVQSMAQGAYEYGVPPKAMEAMCRRYAAEGRRFMKEMQQQQEEAVRQADACLQELWGNRYEDNLRMQATPDFARLMLEAASLMQEAPLHTGAPSDNRQEARRIAHDPTHPLHEAYMRTNHPQHRYANEQYDRLAFGRRL